MHHMNDEISHPAMTRFLLNQNQDSMYSSAPRIASIKSNRQWYLKSIETRQRDIQLIASTKWSNFIFNDTLLAKLFDKNTCLHGVSFQEQNPYWTQKIQHIVTRWFHMAWKNMVFIDSANGLSSVWFQAITWWLLSTESLWTNLSETWIKIKSFSFNKMHLKNVICKMSFT